MRIFNSFILKCILLFYSPTLIQCQKGKSVLPTLLGPKDVIPLNNFTSCDCPRVYLPVCAKDGKSYVNECVLKCAFGIFQRYVLDSITILQTVKLPTRKKSEVFSQFYPAKSFDVRELNTFKNCAECPRMYLPVCGTDNITYTNECYLYCMNEKKVKKKLPKVEFIRTGPCSLLDLVAL